MPPRLTQMSKSKLCKWLLFFVVEVHRQDSKQYPETTLHGILCGTQRHVRNLSRSLERVLTLSVIWSSTFWGMFLMHKWRICVCMKSRVVTYLGGGRKQSMGAWTSGQSECTDIYWKQWYGCVVCILHYTVGWSIRTFVLTRLSSLNPLAHLHTFCTQKIHRKITQRKYCVPHMHKSLDSWLWN